MAVEDGGDWLGPDEEAGPLVVLGHGALDRRLQIYNLSERATLQSSTRQSREEAFDGLELGGRCRSEVEHPAPMARQPSPHLCVRVDTIVVEHHVDDLAGRPRRLDGVEEAQELLVAVTLHPPAVTVPSRGAAAGGAPARRAGPSAARCKSRQQPCDRSSRWPRQAARNRRGPAPRRRFNAKQRSG